MREDNVQNQEYNRSPNPKKFTLIRGLVVVILLFLGSYLVLSRNRVEMDQSIPSEVVNQKVVNDNQLVSDNTFSITDEDSIMLDKVSVINVEGGNFYFNPNEIRVKRGEEVKIVFSNLDGTHDFVIDELSVNSPVIKTGDTAEVGFVAEKTGEFDFYCSVGNHRALGMVGKIIVE